MSTNIIDDDDQLLDEEIANQKSCLSVADELIVRTRHLLQIEPKFLNADNEMIRMFGAKVVNAEKAAKSVRVRKNRYATLCLISPKKTALFTFYL